jgi:uncharacterized YigZ family protein
MMEYAVPEGVQRCEIVVVNSRFITTVARAETPEIAREQIAVVRTALPDASHHVYAFRVGYGNSIIEGMSDDGEPSGTAGPPSLAVLRGRDIGDIVLVTTRYFGGTKLGTGGLVRAYTEAAQTALAQLVTTVKAPKTQLGLDVPYPLYASVKRLIEQHNGHITEEIFGGEVSIFVTLLQRRVADFTADLTTLSHGQLIPIELETGY